MAARVPYVTFEELDAEGQKVYDQIRNDRGTDEVGLQFRALLNSPKAAGHMTSLGAQLRFDSSAPENLKELTIILTAREWNSDIEWTGHSVLAARAGVSDASIEAIRTRKAPEGLTDDEAKIARYVHQLIRDKKVSDSTYQAVEELVGSRGAVDLTLTVSYYSALALAQIGLDLEMQPGRVSTLNG
ncbi:MAG: carboxymuconolactone decarboxylase family protein [Dehalococcoidia bacterium]